MKSDPCFNVGVCHYFPFYYPFVDNFLDFFTNCIAL
jgi:hypothetical protein